MTSHRRNFTTGGSYFLTAKRPTIKQAVFGKQ
jgi:hypothetical protein